jgi:hypothetical protein
MFKKILQPWFPHEIYVFKLFYLKNCSHQYIPFLSTPISTAGGQEAGDATGERCYKNIISL